MNLPVVSLAQLRDIFRPGLLVYLPGATGEILGLHDFFAAEADHLCGVRFVSCLVPGMNSFDYAALNAGTNMTTFLLPPILRASFKANRVEVLPLAYTGIASYLGDLEPDIAFLHLTLPKDGLCSFGVSADFGPIVATKAKRVIGVLNPSMPRPSHGPTIAVEALDDIIELDHPLVVGPVALPSEGALAVARGVVNLIPNKAHIQTGIGGAPAALWNLLGDHRDLSLRSGMVTDGFLTALDSGALANGGHVAGIAYGGVDLYRRLAGSDIVAFADTRTTHSFRRLSQLDKFISVNSALEVDLFGQANLEWQGSRLVSGVGGAPDFVRAARASTGGRSIIALPATASGGQISRIVGRLNGPTSIGRADIDTVVTEYGAAELCDLSMDARAEALISIAAPQFRNELSDSWATFRRTL